LALIRSYELAIGGDEILGSDDRLRTSSKQLRSAGAKPCGEIIELRDERVVELNEHFPSSHDHMVAHMIKPTSRAS
jgi:hypothetical protein